MGLGEALAPVKKVAMVFEKRAQGEDDRWREVR